MLKGVSGYFVVCFRPKAPVGRFLDAVGAALGRFKAHLGWLLGRLGHQAGASLGVVKVSWRRLKGNLTSEWSQVAFKV